MSGGGRGACADSVLDHLEVLHCVDSETLCPDTPPSLETTASAEQMIRERPE